jgi:hypothetical protein
MNRMQINQGIAEMSFGHPQLIDETTDERWVLREGYPLWPIDLPLGDTIGTSFLCQNTGDIAVKVFVSIALIDPDGIVRASGVNPNRSTPQTVNPGVNYTSAYIGGIPLDKLGLWVIYGAIDYGIQSAGEYTTDLTWTAVNAIEGGGGNGGNGGNGGGNGGAVSPAVPWQWIGLGIGAIVALVIVRKTK